MYFDAVCCLSCTKLDRTDHSTTWVFQSYLLVIVCSLITFISLLYSLPSFTFMPLYSLSLSLIIYFFYEYIHFYCISCNTFMFLSFRFTTTFYLFFFSVILLFIPSCHVLEFYYIFFPSPLVLKVGPRIREIFKGKCVQA